MQSNGYVNYLKVIQRLQQNKWLLEQYEEYEQQLQKVKLAKFTWITIIFFTYSDFQLDNHSLKQKADPNCV